MRYVAHARILALLGVSTVAGYVSLQALGHRAGSTAEERAATLPGDELVTAPQMVTDHAITINAQADRI